MGGGGDDAGGGALQRCEPRNVNVVDDNQIAGANVQCHPVRVPSLSPHHHLVPESLATSHPRGTHTLPSARVHHPTRGKSVALLGSIHMVDIPSGGMDKQRSRTLVAERSNHRSKQQQQQQHSTIIIFGNTVRPGSLNRSDGLERCLPPPPEECTNTVPVSRLLVAGMASQTLSGRAASHSDVIQPTRQHVIILNTCLLVVAVVVTTTIYETKGAQRRKQKREKTGNQINDSEREAREALGRNGSTSRNLSSFPSAGRTEG